MGDWEESQQGRGWGKDSVLVMSANSKCQISAKSHHPVSRDIYFRLNSGWNPSVYIFRLLKQPENIGNVSIPYCVVGMEYYFDIPISIYGVLVFCPPWIRVNTGLLCSVNPHT